MRPLTDSQKAVLAFIKSFQEKEGFPPTQAEIAKGMGFRSANAAAQHLRLLTKKGAIEMTPGLARGLRITVPSPLEEEDQNTLPLIGEVAAGQPILALENYEKRVALSPKLFSPKADYLLRVRGDSMIEAGICPNDLVAVHKTGRVKNGSIVVVRLDDEVTVKTWYRHKGQLTLKPANSELKDIHINPKYQSVNVEGVVVGLLRLGLDKR